MDLNVIELEKEYTAAVYSISRTMMDAISLKDLMDYLRWHPDPGLHLQLPHCRNTADVLDLISNYSSMFNINLLEAIVKEFKVEAAKPVIQKYKERIKIVQNSVLHQVLDQARLSLQSETIKFYVKYDVKSCTFDEVQRLIKDAFRENEPYVRMVLISTALDNIETLKEKGVQQLTIGFSTVYDNNDDEDSDINTKTG